MRMLIAAAFLAGILGCGGKAPARDPIPLEEGLVSNRS